MIKKGNLVRISGLSIGEYSDKFEYGDDFLCKIDDFGVKGGKIDVEVVFARDDIGAEMSFDIKGSVIVSCDRCGDDMVYEIDYNDSMPVKLLIDGEIDGTEDIIYFKKDETFVNIDGYVEEMVKLSLPLRVVHENDSMCNAEVIRMLKKVEPQRISSHWDVLNGLNDVNK